MWSKRLSSHPQTNLDIYSIFTFKYMYTILIHIYVLLSNTQVDWYKINL